MLYCTWCANWNKWPVAENKTHGVGRCEYCARPAVLNFTPTEALGEPKELPAEMLTPEALRLRKWKKKAGTILGPDGKIIRPQ